MAVTVDIIDGTSGRLTKDGFQEIERVAIVDGLTGTGYTKIVQAAYHADVPDIGARHPMVSDAYLYEIRPVAEDSGTIRLSLLYRQQKLTVLDFVNAPSMVPQYDTVEVGATLSQIETSFDYLGNRISVSYTYPADYGAEDTPQYKERNETKTTSKTIAKLYPDHQMTVRKQEFTNPSVKALDYVGSVNNGPWSLAPTSVAGQWMCTGLMGTSSDGRRSWDVVYNFQYRPDTWEELVQWQDPFTGEPPDDLVLGTGAKYVALYPMANFNLLGL